MARRGNIEQMSAAKAMERARSNGLRKYPAPDKDGDRLYPLASPNCSPSFKIGPEDTIFAIGSCFARNVEKSLEAAGKRVLSREFELGAIGESLGDAANFFNKYSIHSVTNEIRWALERDSFPGEDLIYPLGKGRYCDSQLGMAKLDFPMDDILAFRHRYLDAMAQAATADVLILTLGYVETWYDTKLGLYLNVSPPGPLIKEDPERFEFRVLSYQDVLDGLEDLYALLQKHRTKPLKMLVTVSPVPLLATFRDMDVLVANAYSKSVQRAALDEFLIGKDGVDYFPSYEFVTLSNPTVAWSRGDYRHVSPDVVNRIMSNVLTNYVEGAVAEAGDSPTETMTPEALMSSVRMMQKLEDYEAIVDLLSKNRELADGDVDVLLFESAALRRLERVEDAWDALVKAVNLAPGRPMPLERLIMLCRPLRRHDDARKLMDVHAAKFPNRDTFRDRVDWL
ncbi:GSCFA family protein [Loktanella sp. IMCC34160]|uniref:GSCFA domain-containing protein n=1 Tax=Loktanella sp. IMCC34160 TaxID=2510646 RepID=UPI00101C66CF|nr:GSCFA domain-containing protein [Loktanella sp. IMCC34160]RYG89812.1 GSCFA family protein [Loktanella sp. IMCC34160]